MNVAWILENRLDWKDGWKVAHLRNVILYAFMKGIIVGNAWETKPEINLDCAPTLRPVNRFDRFSQGDCNLKDQTRSGRPSLVDEDALLAIVENKSRVLIEELAMSLKIDLNCFSPFEEAWVQEKRRPLANRQDVIFHHNNEGPHIAKETLQKISWNGRKPSNTHCIILIWLLWIFICFRLKRNF